MQPQPSTNRTVPVYSYVPAVFNGAPPPPSSPCLDELPWVKKEREAQEAKQKEMIAKQKRAEEVAKAKKKSGFFNQVTAIAKDIGYQTVSAVESGVHSTTKAVTDQVEKNKVQRFHAAFPDYGPTEKLLLMSSGKVVSGGAPIQGELYISQNHVSFKGIYKDTKTNPGQVVNHDIIFKIPFASIVSLQQATTEWPGKDKTVAPTLKPAVDPKDVPTALMLFTNDQRVHLLYQFLNYKDLWNVLDHHWRAIINPNYMPAAGFVPVSPTAPAFDASPSAPPAYDEVSSSSPLYPNLK